MGRVAVCSMWRNEAAMSNATDPAQRLREAQNRFQGLEMNQYLYDLFDMAADELERLAARVAELEARQLKLTVFYHIVAQACEEAHATVGEAVWDRALADKDFVAAAERGKADIAAGSFTHTMLCGAASMAATMRTTTDERSTDLSDAFNPSGEARPFHKIRAKYGAAYFLRQRGGGVPDDD
jgi:hypothetical protein